MSPNFKFKKKLKNKMVELTFVSYAQLKRVKYRKWIRQRRNRLTWTRRLWWKFPLKVWVWDLRSCWKDSNQPTPNLWPMEDILGLGMEILKKVVWWKKLSYQVNFLIWIFLIKISWEVFLNSYFPQGLPIGDHKNIILIALFFNELQNYFHFSKS